MKNHIDYAISVNSILTAYFLIIDSDYFEYILDTDSILIALSREDIEELVKPEKRHLWPAVKEKWFADETPLKQKTPGYLKEEFKSVDGIFVGLSSKCYILTAGDLVKRSQKGVPRNLGMSIEQFTTCLLENHIPKTKYGTIVQDKKQGSCVTKIVTKRALNPVYYKHFVSNNGIDVSPFKDGDNFL